MALEIFKLVGSVLVNTDEAEKSIKKVDGGAKEFGETLLKNIGKAGEWAVGLTAAAATVATAIGVDAVKAASDFEQSFAKVNTLLSDRVNIDDYKQAIIDLSNESGVAVGDLNEAIYSAISAGVDEANAIDFVNSALELAEGGFTDAATAVDVMTTAINAYGLSAEDAQQVSDYLITTQNLGKTTVDELASSLGKVIPVASAYNVNMADLSTNMAIMTKNGIATAEATTYTKQMLSELGDSGSNVSAILQEETGKTFAELEAEGYSLGDVIGILGDSVDGDATAFNELWGSSTAALGALTLMNAGSEEYNDTLASMNDSLGATTEAYKTMHGTFETSMETIKTNMSNVMVSLGEALLPTVESVADFVIQQMPVIQGLIVSLAPVLTDMFSKLLPPLLDLASTLLPVIVDMINQLMPVISSLLQQILPIAVDLITTLAPIISQILTALLPVAQEILTPIIAALGPIVDALGPLIDLFLLLNEPLFKLLEDILPPLIEVVSAFIAVFAEDLGVCVEAASIWINETLIPAFQGIWDKIKKVKDDVLEAFGNLKEGIGKAVDGIKQKVGDTFSALVELVKTPINTIIGLLNKFIQGVNKIKIDVPEWAKDIAGIDSIGFNIPEIPLLAKGGDISGAGSAIVGEAGAELIDLPKGASVTPLEQGTGGTVGAKLEVMCELLQELIEIMPEAVAEGVSRLELNFNDRELGRLIKAYE